MSFVDPMGNTARTEREITLWSIEQWLAHSSLPEVVVMLIKAVGMKMEHPATGKPMYQLDSDEAAEIFGFVALLFDAQERAKEMRVLNTILTATLAYEAALARIAQPVLVLEPTVTVFDDYGKSIEVPNPEIKESEQERGDAQAVIDAVTPEVQALYDLRHPVTELAAGEGDAPDDKGAA